MEEEPDVGFAVKVYKGPDSIPHVPAEFFGAWFLATGVSASYQQLSSGTFRCSMLAGHAA